MSLSVAFITSSFIIFPVQEKISKAKLVGARTAFARALCSNSVRCRTESSGSSRRRIRFGIESTRLVLIFISAKFDMTKTYFQMQLMTGVNKFIYFVSSVLYDIQLHFLCSLLLLATLLIGNPDGVYTHYVDTSCKLKKASQDFRDWNQVTVPRWRNPNQSSDFVL